MTQTTHQLPSSMVAEAFGEVNVRLVGSELEVEFTVLMEPQGAEAEGWQTGVALDASASMMAQFGQVLEGRVPDDHLADYQRRGLIVLTQRDGRSVREFRPAGLQDAVSRGFLRFSENTVQPLAQRFIAYLAGNLDADGGTTVIYWACGDGGGTEVVGDFTAEQCAALRLGGPSHSAFGDGTRLTPAVRYFADRFVDAKRGMYVFVTDGRLDDLAEVKSYTIELARAVAAARRNPIKCVLIGVGPDIDESQMEQLDDLETGTGVDIWDHKIAAEMRGLSEIFAEVVTENHIVAPSGRILDVDGRVVREFKDGLPAKVKFRLPKSSSHFDLEVPGGRIRQVVAGDRR